MSVIMLICMCVSEDKLCGCWKVPFDEGLLVCWNVSFSCVFVNLWCTVCVSVVYYHQADDDDDKDGEEEDYSVKTFSVPGMVPLQDILLQETDTDTHTQFLCYKAALWLLVLRFTVSIVADGKSHNINKLHEAARWDFNIKHTHTPQWRPQ